MNDNENRPNGFSETESENGQSPDNDSATDRTLPDGLTEDEVQPSDLPDSTNEAVTPSDSDDADNRSDSRHSRDRRTVSLKAFIAGCISFAVIGAIIALAIVPNSLKLRLGGGDAYSKLAALDKIVGTYYLGADEIDSGILSDMVAWGYIYALGDKYSAYLDADTYSQIKYSNSGGSDGIGITVAYYDAAGGMYVVRVSAGSPAAQSGIVNGDIITAVDGNAVTADAYSDLLAAIRGESGTQVTLTVTHADGTSSDIAVTRGQFTTESVYYHMIGDAGYIRITDFNDATVDQFAIALNSVTASGATRLIFDLRGNSGGLVTAASNMLDRLLPEGEIGYAVYADGHRESMAMSDESCVDLPIAVLTDASTASSAEYFASALRDSADATLIGGKTFGKGIMQRTYPLGDGSAVRVTIAKFYTESGTEFHGVGLEPDIAVAYSDEQKAVWFTLNDEDDPFIAEAIRSEIAD